MRIVQGCSFVMCCLCHKEILVADAVAKSHPDDPSSIVCHRCADEHHQIEIEEMRREAYRYAALSYNGFCRECGEACKTWDEAGNRWCSTCQRFDQIYEDCMFDGTL